MKHLNRHHSTGDWDFDSVNWKLDSAVYVSAPSSLCVNPPAGTTWTTTCWVKTSTVPIANVKEGRVITYYYISSYASGRKFRVLLRYQDVNNYYYVQFYQANATTVTVSIVQRKAGVETVLWSGNVSLANGTWHRIRVTWWNDSVGIVLRAEYWDGATWTLIQDAYDSENLWKNIGGRVGATLTAYNNSKTNLDDTEIYGIPP